jgi:hypothetical protein
MMIDWDSVEFRLDETKAIAFDGCHKIYLLLDDEQVGLMREYEYDHIITKDEQPAEVMLGTLKEWFAKSCGLRFVEAVETNHEDPNAGFETLIEQGATDEEVCEDCYEVGCYGSCSDWEDEDEEDED